MGQRSFVFQDGNLCLKQKDGNSIYPYYPLKSDQKDIPFRAPKLKEVLKKNGGINKNTLLAFCRKYKKIDCLFDNFNPPEIQFVKMKKKGGREKRSSESWISKAQIQFIEGLKSGDNLIITLSFKVIDPKDEFSWRMDEIGPLVYKIVE